MDLSLSFSIFFPPHLFYPSTPFLPLLLLFSRSADYHKSLQWSSGVNTPLDLQSLSSFLVVQTYRTLLSFPDMPRPPTFSTHKRKQNQQLRTKKDSNKSDSAYFKLSFFHPDYVRWQTWPHTMQALNYVEINSLMSDRFLEYYGCNMVSGGWGDSTFPYVKRKKKMNKKNYINVTDYYYF